MTDDSTPYHRLCVYFICQVFPKWINEKKPCRSQMFNKDYEAAQSMPRRSIVFICGTWNSEAT
jgi:hypothetical protein